MNEYASIRKELLKLKEKNGTISQEIISKLIEEKIKDSKTKRVFLTIGIISISIILILIFRRRN